jgi:hypothetical protein
MAQRGKDICRSDLFSCAIAANGEAPETVPDGHLYQPQTADMQDNALYPVPVRLIVLYLAIEEWEIIPPKPLYTPLKEYLAFLSHDPTMYPCPQLAGPERGTSRQQPLPTPVPRQLRPLHSFFLSSFFSPSLTSNNPKPTVPLPLNIAMPPSTAIFVPQVVCSVPSQMETVFKLLSTPTPSC